MLYTTTRWYPVHSLQYLNGNVAFEKNNTNSRHSFFELSHTNFSLYRYLLSPIKLTSSVLPKKSTNPAFKLPILSIDAGVIVILVVGAILGIITTAALIWFCYGAIDRIRYPAAH